MPVVELNGTLRTASKVTATQAAVEVLGMVEAEAEAEAAIFSGEQVRRGCNLYGGDGVGSLTWIVRKSALALNGFGFFHSAGISQIRHLKGGSKYIFMTQWFMKMAACLAAFYRGGKLAHVSDGTERVS
jgi:hypothetical protein